MKAPLQERNDSDAAQKDAPRKVVFADNRPEAMAQRKLVEMMRSSQRVVQQSALNEPVIQRYIEITDPRNPTPFENGQEPKGKLRMADGKFKPFDSGLWNRGIAYRANIYEDLFGHAEDEVPLSSGERLAQFEEHTLKVLSEMSGVIEEFRVLNNAIELNVQAIRQGNLEQTELQEKRSANMELGPKLTDKKNQIMDGIFKRVERREDLAALTKLFLEGKIIGLPYVSGPLAEETGGMLAPLINLNKKGVITYESQPSEKTGEKDEVIYSQQAFISFSLPRNTMYQLEGRVKKYNKDNAIPLVLSSASEPERQPLKLAFSRGPLDVDDVPEPKPKVKQTEEGYFYKIYAMGNSPQRYLNLIKKAKGREILSDECVATIFFDSFKAEDTGKLTITLLSLIDE
jgi:hypothetical protein